MFKQGLTKVPFNKIPALAKALDADPVRMLRRAMREYEPEMLESIEGIVGMLVTENEREIIEALREHTQGSDPRMTNSEQRRRLAAFSETLTQ